MSVIEIPKFNGGWSYTQKEMNTLFKFIEYKDEYSILEFGGGHSTQLLYNHFKKYCKNLDYTVYETDMQYIKDLEVFNKINVELYDSSKINDLELDTKIYDLILVDGPNGELRSLWYLKLRKCVKEGTIILIDDFNHFKSFSEELDKNFNYELLDHYDEGPYIPWGEHSWKIVKVISCKEMPLLISIPFGRTTSMSIERCKNILEYIPEAIIIANFATGTNTISFEDIFKKELNSKIFINTIPRVKVDNAEMDKMFVKNLLHVHITNYYYAVQKNIEFTHIMFLSDMDMITKKGVYNFIKVYDAGFFQANSFIKPLSLEIKDFAPNQFINQRNDEFWIKSVFENSDFINIYAEQMEGQFYKKELFKEMIKYIENLPVHYSKAITNLEEGIFSNVYMNIFKNKYPIFLPISIILRDDSITENHQRLFNIFIGEDIRKNNRSHATFESYNAFTYGIKRVDYDKEQHLIVNKIIQESQKYIDYLYHNIRTKYVYVKTIT